jgi:MFS transporter, DHA1 family, multidrug resistance protein
VTVASAPPRLGRVEFTALLALSMSLAALGIDAVLPAFPEIRADFGLAPDSTQVAGIITTYLLGLALGQVFYGPVADRFGRKPALYVGYAVYVVGAAASTFAPDLGTVLAARFVWGLGAAGPRVVTLSIVRDRYDGEAMARAMSFILAVFVLVPVVAPTLGAFIVSVAAWRWISGVCLVLALGMAVWAIRLEETLAPEHRMELRLGRILAAGREVMTHRQTLGYTVALSALFGVFTSYLASSEIIFTDVFDQGERFPLIFGAMAGTMGVAMLLNTRLVRRFGTRRTAHAVLVGYVVVAAATLAAAVVSGGRPPLGVFLVGLAAMLFSHALLIPNFNTIAMDPMAHIAGTASAVIGTVSTALGAGLGAVLDRSFDGTVLPFSLGSALLALVALGLVAWTERGDLFRPPPDPSAI